MVSYLLDTNICIYALKNRPPSVLERLEAVGRARTAISVITVMELRHGAENSQNPPRAHAKLDLFLAPIRVLPFEEGAALMGAHILAYLSRRGKLIGDLDILIAAQAVVSGMTLVTNNLDEFERVPDLRTENWV
ncbi:MAG TPA: type II toxin-antitoxin system VapC family toxin [Thermoanaerobaculia bacterium]|nr:type II toxin-antitoxin system VapC family toxin [Thermoanaerobaculia bacterium]